MVIPNLKFSEMGGGGYSRVNFGHPKCEVFRNGGVVFRSKFGSKFTVQPETCLCITVVSHILRMWRLMNCFIIHIIPQRSSKSLSISGGHGGRDKIKNAEMQMFVILLLITFTFLILTTPAYLLVIYVMFVHYEESAKSFADFTLFYSVAQKTYYTNYAMNFFLYVISGKKFRADLVQLVKKSADNQSSVSRSQSNSTLSSTL